MIAVIRSGRDFCFHRSYWRLASAHFPYTARSVREIGSGAVSLKSSAL
jgi:hypothetical protein